MMLVAYVVIPAALAYGQDADLEAEIERESRNIFGLKRAYLDEPLVTDRPDFTESALTIPAGWFQLEAGYTFTYDKEDDVRVRSHTGPEMLMRIGLVEDFELRIGWFGYSYTRTSQEQLVSRPIGPARTERVNDWEQGANDLELGFKWRVLDQDGLVPELAVLGSLTVPIGSSTVSSGDVVPLIGFLWGYELTEDLGMAGQVLFSTPTDGGERFFQTAASLSFAYSLSDRWGVYTEYFGFYPNTEDTDAAHVMNGGITYLVTNDFQIDVRAGFGLNEEADDFFTGVGFSWRF